MKVASVSELKDGLSAYLENVRMGHVVLVTDRRRPVAVLQKVEQADLSKAAWGLVEQSLARPPARPLAVKNFLSLPKAPEGVALSQAIVDEREDR